MNTIPALNVVFIRQFGLLFAFFPQFPSQFFNRQNIRARTHVPNRN